MRAVRKETSSILVVALISLGLGVAFPREVLSFRASAPRAVPSGAAFVSLDAAAEAALLQSVRESWRKASGTGRLYADLVFTELPALPRLRALPIATRGRTPPLPAVADAPGPYLPSVRAPDPAPLPPETVRRQLAFPRDELLRIR